MTLNCQKNSDMFNVGYVKLASEMESGPENGRTRSIQKYPEV